MTVVRNMRRDDDITSLSNGEESADVLSVDGGKSWRVCVDGKPKRAFERRAQAETFAYRILYGMSETAALVDLDLQ